MASELLMQNIAMENNLAETAFVVPQGNRYEIRWFTPAVEVDLCGHATLASAYVLFHYTRHQGDEIEFHSPRSGRLTVTREDDFLTLNFPADQMRPIDDLTLFDGCFDIVPVAAYRGKTDFMLVFSQEKQIRELMPDFQVIKKLEARGVIVTAPGEQADFVSRFFAPQCGIDEDPVTGSAHTTLTPYWSSKLGKKSLSAIQLSKRTGALQCEMLGDRVEISGKARLYLIGEIEVG